MNKLVEKSCVAFTEVLASKAAVPGGGGAAALVGALGTALCSMVGNLTVGRKKCAAFEEDNQIILAKAEKIQLRLLELVDEDASAFEPLSKAYAIPKDDPKRAEIMAQVTREACKAPMEMMRYICQAIELLEEMLDKGSAGERRAEHLRQHQNAEKPDRGGEAGFGGGRDAGRIRAPGAASGGGSDPPPAGEGERLNQGSNVPDFKCVRSPCGQPQHRHKDGHSFS